MFRVTRVLISSLALLIAVLGLSGFSPIWAQSSGATTASVTGIVSDEQGSVIAGVIVSAKNLDTNFTREASTDETGNYLLQQLPPGKYDITVTGEGFATQNA